LGDRAKSSNSNGVVESSSPFIFTIILPPRMKRERKGASSFLKKSIVTWEELMKKCRFECGF
jgi:hypothetical protein